MVGIIFPLLYGTFFFALARVEGKKFEIDKFAKTLLIGLIIHLLALAFKADPFALATLGAEAGLIVMLDHIINRLGVTKPTGEELKTIIRFMAVMAGVDPKKLENMTVEQMIAELVERLKPKPET